MARINDTTTFPNQTSPALDDHVIGTDVSDVSTSADGQTVTFRLGDILALATPAFEFIETVDLSSDSTVEFTGFDSTKYDGYKFLLQGVQLSAAADRVLACRFSVDGGASYLTTGYTSTGSSSYVYLGAPNNGESVSGVLELPGPHLTKDTVITVQTAWQGASVGNRVEVGHFATSSAVDAIQFFFDGGTLASGTITMYGMRNS